MAGSNRHILLQQGSPEAKAEQRRLASAVAIVAGIAVTHVAATQLAAACVRQYPQLTPLLLVWIGTASNLLLLPPQLCRPRHGSPLGLWALRPARLLLLAAPFFLLWIGANGLYISALSRLSSSLVVSIFSATPALVAVLSGPILARPLTLPSTLAVATSVAGVVIAAEPWAAAAAAPPPVGAMSAFGAACCAALYKVLFRHFFGDASGWLLLLFLALLGGYALVLGTPLLFLAQPGWPAALASLPVAGWMLMVGRCGTDVLFNGLIALGLSVTHPLFVSLGTLLATPLNLTVQLARREAMPTAAALLGIVAICAGFAILILDELVRVGGWRSRPWLLGREGGRDPPRQETARAGQMKRASSAAHSDVG